MVIAVRSVPGKSKVLPN